MENISLVVIAHNEEMNIERCLASVKDICNEIIVVDSFSTDQTLEICEKFNAKVFQKKWAGYSLQKNFGNEKASNNYILSLDADEVLSDDLRASIKEIKESGFKGAYAFNRLNNYCGKWIKHTSWYPDRKLRIWNKNEGQWEGDIHEEVKFSNDIPVQQLKGDLLHYSYASITQHISQYNLFTDYVAEEAFSKHKRSNLFIAFYKSFWKFFREYFFKLGLLDGYYGFVVSILSSHATFLKYLKLRELNKNAKRH